MALFLSFLALSFSLFLSFSVLCCLIDFSPAATDADAAAILAAASAALAVIAANTPMA